MPIARTTQAVSTALTSARSVSVNVADVTDLVVAGFGVGGLAAQPSLLVNSTAATLVANSTFGSVILGEGRIALGYLFPASTGAITVSSTSVGAPPGAILAAAVYTGVSTVAPVGSTVLSTGNSTALSATVNSSAGNLSVAIGVVGSSLASMSSAGGITEILEGQSAEPGDFLLTAMAELAGASPSVTFPWNLSTGVGKMWAVAAMTLNPIAAGRVSGTWWG